MLNFKNLYVCSVGHATMTLDRDEGTTPFSIICRHPGCNLRAISSFYEIPKEYEGMTATWEWYCPSESELRKLDGAIRDYAKRGGLLLRQIAAAEVA